jgi:hypothetical protein
MAVAEERADLLYVYGQGRLHKWRRRHSVRRYDDVTVGWLPDGRWFVGDSRERNIGWVYTGPQVQARDAAMGKARELMDGDGWVGVTAQYRPGTQEPDDVPEWPPGHEPG